nr:retrovirus-related Pol polyprotein from transposon 17.6 [Tanacetum cinerariifolium]
MADNRTMAELLQAPTEGYEDTIFFPPSKTTNIRNEIMRFQQRFDESFYEAWDRFNELLRACPHHVFSELHHLDTFYNALNVNDQDSLNSATGVVSKVSTSSSTPAISFDVAERKDMVRALLLDKKNQSSAPAPSPTPAPIKAVEPNYVTCGGAHSYQNWSGTLPSNTITNPKEDLKGITTRSGVAYQGPTIPTPSKVVKQGTEVTKDQVQTPSSQSTAPVQPPVVQSETQTLVFEPVVAPVSALMPNLKPSIPYPSRHDNERCRDQANEQIEKFYEIFKDMSFEISFTYALILMPKFASTLKALIGNKEKLSEMARTSMNEHCLAVILNKFPRKLGDPDKFLIPCEFPGMDECLALADLGASINLMPLFMWEGLSLSELTPTCMTLKLADRSVSKPIGIAKDVSVKVGVFHFPADFVVVDFEPDPRVPLILGRCFLKTDRALIDVHKGELTLRIGNEAISYNLDQTSRYSANYNQIMTNKIDKELKVCEAKTVKSSVDEPPKVELKDLPPHLEYAFLEGDNKLPDVISNELGDEDKSALIKVLKSHKRAITWKLSDIQAQHDAFLGLEDDPNLPEFNPFYYDPEGDILLLEAILNSEPLPPLPNHEQYMPSFKKELKVYEAKTVKSSVDEPPEVELKDLPPHLEYAFLEGDNKLPIIIAKELGDEEKSALVMVLKSHKRAIAWKLSDIQGINPEFYTHKILMEEDYKPAVQHQRRVNPKIYDVIKKEVEKLLDAGLIYPISDSPWVSPLNEATRKDHFPLPFMDQMLKRLAGNEYYYFLNGFSGYFQIPINPRDQEKTTFTCPYGTFAYRRMPFGLCNAPGTFQRCMLAIFHDMVEKRMEVFMNDFSVFGNSFENCLSRLDKCSKGVKTPIYVLTGRRAILWSKRALSPAIRFLRMGLRLAKPKSMSLLNYLIPQLSKVFGVFSVTPVLPTIHSRFFQNFPTDDSSS